MTSAAEPGNGSTPSGPVWRAIVCVIALVTIFSVTQGITYPLLSLILERQDTSGFLVGLSGAMTPLGVLVSAPFLPALARRVDRGTLLAGCLISSAGLLAALAAFQDVMAWMPLRFLLGVAVNGLYVIGETALVQIAPDRYRARVMAAYTGITNLGYALGPALLALTSSQGYVPFAVGIAILFAGFVPLLLARGSGEHIDQGREAAGSIFRFMAHAPVVVVAYAATALFDTALMTLFPIYALDYGMSEGKASSVLTAILLGGVVLQYPIGWLADRSGRRRIIYACTVASVIGCVAVPLSMDVPLLIWVVAVAWGGPVFGVQTLLLAEISARFSGAMLNAGNAAFGFTWGVSAVVGVPMAGMAMDWIGPNGLMATVGVLFVVTLVMMPFERR